MAFPAALYVSVGQVKWVKMDLAEASNLHYLELQRLETNRQSTNSDLWLLPAFVHRNSPFLENKVHLTNEFFLEGAFERILFLEKVPARTVV